MNVRPLRVVLGLVALLVTCAAGPLAIAAPPYNNNNNNKGWPNNNQPADEPQTGVFKFVSKGEATANGHRYATANLAPVSGNGTARLFVPNQEDKPNEPKPQLLEAVEKLKAGDIVSVEYKKYGSMLLINSIRAIPVKPGEESPNGFQFMAYDEGSGSAPGSVRLMKFGQEVEVGVPTVREKGKSEPDPQVVAALAAFKEGDVVFAQITPGRPPLLTSIYPYKEPQTGKLTKLTTQEIEANPKAPAVEIETSDGKTITALLQGRTNNKRWIPDPNLVRLVHQIKPGSAIVFMAVGEADKSVLVQIAKAPPAPREPASGGGGGRPSEPNMQKGEK